MARYWAMLALVTATVFSTASAACVDIEQYLDIPSPMTGDLEINLDEVDTIECVEIEVAGEANANLLETVVVDGGTLTLKSVNNVGFVDIAFTVINEGNLVFDMPKTKFGPNNEGAHRGSYGSSTVTVEAGASVTFEGKVVAKEVTNVFNLLQNAGSMEFKKRVLFQDGGSVLTGNTGVVKFRADATFKDNRYYSLENEGSAYVRFSKDAFFDDNAYNLDGASGCSVVNRDQSKISFRGESTFKNNNCREASAVYNEGDITFYGKAYFNDNAGENHGAGARNVDGTMSFKAAAQFNNNFAEYEYTGGGIYVRGGDVVFSKAVTFDGNTADSGSAFAVDGGSLTFKKPEAVISRNAITYDNTFSDDLNCTFGEVSDEGTVIGFSGDDVCVPAEAD
eukprot:jgi/Undpi1/5194/HiC_scaffold_2.g00477.m1